MLFGRHTSDINAAATYFIRWLCDHSIIIVEANHNVDERTRQGKWHVAAAYR